jgi:WD40 repeat protein
MDRKCIVIDIGKEKIQKKFNIQKTFDYHKHGVNSIDWHPYKSLIVSSSIQINDTIKLWDPHSEELVHEAALHKSIISKVIFHPEGNSYFSLSKDNLISEHEIRRPGVINKFYL